VAKETMLNYRANGKLLLTSEYAITQGAKGLAIPTTKGQTLQVDSESSDEAIVWESIAHDGTTWFSARLIPRTLEIIESTNANVAARLVQNLQVVLQNTDLLDQPQGFTTQLEFPNEWGLGSSSTFTSLLAQCAGVNALEHFRTVHGGSGYDLACATADGPIIYQLQNEAGIVCPATIDFDFTDDLGFVYLGKKQLTSESLNLVQRKPFSLAQIETFNALTDAFLNASNIDDLERVIEEHESILSEHLGLAKVKEMHFSSYPGTAKSLGGWGGDFAMVTRFASSRKWLTDNGYKVIFPFKSLGQFS
jgi:mevalonate kinase